MQLLDTAAIFRFHQYLAAKYGGNSFSALGWKTAGAQLARYQILSRIGDLNNCTVMDVGCGYGDLRNYLATIYPKLSYVGIEQIPSFLDVAIDRSRGLSKTVFLEADFSTAVLPLVDYIFACGSLSYRNSDPMYLFKMIEKLFNHCRRGFAFNLLRTTTDPVGIITAYNPDLILNFCRQLTDHIAFAEGYWESDFTVMLYHEPACAGG